MMLQVLIISTTLALTSALCQVKNVSCGVNQNPSQCPQIDAQKICDPEMFVTPCEEYPISIKKICCQDKCKNGTLMDRLLVAEPSVPISLELCPPLPCAPPIADIDIPARTLPSTCPAPCPAGSICCPGCGNYYCRQIKTVTPVLTCPERTLQECPVLSVDAASDIRILPNSCANLPCPVGSICCYDCGGPYCYPRTPVKYPSCSEKCRHCTVTQKCKEYSRGLFRCEEYWPYCSTRNSSSLALCAARPSRTCGDTECLEDSSCCVDNCNEAKCEINTLSKAAVIVEEISCRTLGRGCNANSCGPNQSCCVGKCNQPTCYP